MSKKKPLHPATKTHVLFVSVLYCRKRAAYGGLLPVQRPSEVVCQNHSPQTQDIFTIVLKYLSLKCFGSLYAVYRDWMWPIISTVLSTFLNEHHDIRIHPFRALWEHTHTYTRDQVKTAYFFLLFYDAALLIFYDRYKSCHIETLFWKC